MTKLSDEQLKAILEVTSKGSMHWQVGPQVVSSLCREVIAARAMRESMFQPDLPNGYFIAFAAEPSDVAAYDLARDDDEQ